MEAGREVDALVAEKVMGNTNLIAICPDCGADVNEGLLYPGIGCTVPCGWKLPYSDGVSECPHYSTDIAAAWAVWEKLPYPKRLSEGDPEGDNDPEYRQFGVMCGGKEYGWDTDFSEDFFGEADTAPLAICLAALKAVGVEVPA